MVEEMGWTGVLWCNSVVWNAALCSFGVAECLGVRHGMWRGLACVHVLRKGIEYGVVCSAALTLNRSEQTPLVTVASASSSRDYRYQLVCFTTKEPILIAST
jgi:hypothetical protein